MKRPLKVALTVVGLLALGINLDADADPGHHGHTMGTVTDLEWTAIGSLPPGAMMAKVYGDPAAEGPFIMRIRMPGDYEIPPHWHPVHENVTVLTGTFHMGPGETFDRDAATALAAGDFAVMEPETRHFAFTSEDTVIQLHGQGPWQIHYVNEEDDPRE